jgi:hypothetical protein
MSSESLQPTSTPKNRRGRVAVGLFGVATAGAVGIAAYNDGSSQKIEAKPAVVVTTTSTTEQLPTNTSDMKVEVTPTTAAPTTTIPEITTAAPTEVSRPANGENYYQPGDRSTFMNGSFKLKAGAEIIMYPGTEEQEIKVLDYDAMIFRPEAKDKAFCWDGNTRQHKVPGIQ